ncbi:MAG: glycosyltransferase family 39 protein [Candidatus Promineifilaceae bacterium]|nr:glycosyltransferase family 39 protein [Candidatus Promineifilaceae bacterium]
MSEKRFLALILALFLLLGAAYALVTPVFEASDELWHYPMVRHLADGNGLPVQVFDPAQAGPWKQEASQPPLYYYVGAALTFWIDTSDMEHVRWLNPHVDNGVITEDGNINLVVHDPAASPWQGTLLAVRIIRLASVLMGAATVYLTYRIAREVVPRRPTIALGAAAVNAFIPMFLFISGAVNNDNLAIPLASLALLLMLRHIRAGRTAILRWRDEVRQWAMIGVVIGLAVLTKEGTLGLLPLAWGTAFISVWQQLQVAPRLTSLVASGATSGRERMGPASVDLTFAAFMRLLARSFVRFGIVLVPVLLIAGWWYYRNLVLYGDLLGWNAFIAVLGQRPQPATLAQLWDERAGFLMSYWGLFGGVNVPMPGWIYTVLNTVLVVAVPGFVVYFARELWDWIRETGSWRFDLGATITNVLYFVESRFALVVCLLFSAAVVYGLINWTTTTWSSQGRLAFTAISTLTTLLVLGLAGWLPRRPAIVIVSGLALFLFVVAAAAPFLWIAPSYEARVGAPSPLPAEMARVEAEFGADCTCRDAERMRLVAYEIEAPARGGGDALRPGDTVEVTLVWEALAEMEQDWSVFVHLNDPMLATPLAQRDMYPGQGLLATRLLEPGQQIVNRYHLRVPETAIAPSELELAVGLYDFETGERLLTAAGTERDILTLETLLLEPSPGEYPNATSVNFGDRMELVGFSVTPRRARPGETVQLTVYWRALRSLETDYTIFAQVLHTEDTTRWAASDVPGNTTAWPEGEVQTIEMPLTLREEAPAGVFPLVVGAYTRTEDGGFTRLQIVRDGRITMDDVLTLTRIRIE